VVRGIDRVAGEKRSRSAVVDDVLRGYLSYRERATANARDAKKINRFADELNAEMQDVLAYQSLDHLRRSDEARPVASTKNRSGHIRAAAG
jgi:metal-responsive CopG/Arc/MetJ family transcriptional regulator